MIARKGQDMIARKEQPGHDSQEGKTDQTAGKDSKDKIARKGPPGQDSQERTTRT
jgi:hypothetical protein